MIWLACALMLMVSILILVKRASAADLVSAKDSALAHYREQLAALERDRENDKISADDYAVNKAESSRNLIRENKADSDTPVSKDVSTPLLVGMIAVIAVGALAIYITVGSPNLGRAVQADKEASLDQTIQGADITVRQALSRMEADLADNPDKIQALALYANTHLQLANYQKASATYEKLKTLQPRNDQWAIGAVEAMMGQSAGQMSPAVDLMVDRLMHQFPESPAGPYLKGQGYIQRGEKEKALAILEAFASKSPADAPWMRSFMPQIRALKYPMPAVDSNAMQKVAAMSDTERKVFFSAMGDRLQARLADKPDYPEAYQRLARVRMMTGDTQAAIKALKQGISGSSDPAQAAPLVQMLDKLTEKPQN